MGIPLLGHCLTDMFSNVFNAIFLNINMLVAVLSIIAKPGVESKFYNFVCPYEGILYNHKKKE